MKLSSLLFCKPFLLPPLPRLLVFDNTGVPFRDYLLNSDAAGFCVQSFPLQVLSLGAHGCGFSGCLYSKDTHISQCSSYLPCSGPSFSIALISPVTLARNLKASMDSPCVCILCRTPPPYSLSCRLSHLLPSPHNKASDPVSLPQNQWYKALWKLFRLHVPLLILQGDTQSSEVAPTEPGIILPHLGQTERLPFLAMLLWLRPHAPLSWTHRLLSTENSLSATADLGFS